MNLRIENLQRDLPLLPGRSLLDAALSAGLNLPHSCKGGNCGSCAARLITVFGAAFRADEVIARAHAKREVRADALRGHFRIPDDELAAHGLAHDDLLHAQTTPATATLFAARIARTQGVDVGTRGVILTSGSVQGIALAVNLLLLVAILSMLQATLTLPGMAAMALALGMAIDSNVLINERVREELRNGVSPQAAIHAGYDRAWATIFDSNITTLIAGLALLAFGSGPVRGFAVVHCIGILTSMFSAVFFSRGLVNLWYGQKKKLKTVSIGTVWRPDGAGTVAAANGNEK
mgnify:CR=1 FL=1